MHSVQTVFLLKPGGVALEQNVDVCFGVLMKCDCRLAECVCLPHTHCNHSYDQAFCAVQ